MICAAGLRLRQQLGKAQKNHLKSRIDCLLLATRQSKTNLNSQAVRDYDQAPGKFIGRFVSTAEKLH
jgi:hypothetical protein